MLAPVVVFVYNRPQHTKQTLDKLNKSSLASETDLFIYSDYPKNEKDIKNVEAVRSYIDSLEQYNNFKSIHVNKAIVNKGLAKSVIFGVTDVISRYGKVIVVEDDLITSDDFLEYMNKALDYYKLNKKIWSISGYTFPMQVLNNYYHDIYLGYRGSSWGWATWKDRWETIDWEVSDYKKFKFNYKLRSMLNRGGHDMSNMLDMQMRGDIDSWAIRWCYQQSKMNMLTIFPKESRVKNIGVDGSGTHGANTKEFNTDLYRGIDKCLFEDISLNNDIVKEFKKKFSPNFYQRIKQGIKSFILRILIR